MVLSSSAKLSLAALPLMALVAPAVAQELPVTDAAAQAAPDTAMPDDDEILVVATRLRGQVDAPQAPIATLDEADIASYGASSLPDLIAALSPQTGSGRGRGGGMPILLVNGQRVSGFRELRNFPPEAIRRMEILPEEVALRFGYPPNQRVVNLILKDNFSSTTVDVEYGLPTRGGFDLWEGEASLLRIDGPSRINLSAEIEDTSPLTEGERGVIQSGDAPAAGALDPADYRTLIADSRQLSLNGTLTRGLGDKGLGGQVSVNAAFTRNDSRSFSGLRVDDPLERRTRTDTVEGSLTFNKPIGSWQLTATVDASRAMTDSLIDQSAAAGRDSASSTADSATSLVTMVGRPVRLPAGEVTATVKAGFAHTAIRSEDSRTATGETRLKRGDLSAGINVGVPLASRREGVLDAIGDLSLNFSAGLNRLSDFGTLKDWSAGLTWAPTEKLNLQASYLVNEAAPTLGQLGDPTVLTYNVPVFDVARSETALVTIISGGNRDLVREKQRDLKLGVTWELPFLKNSNLIAEYFRNSSDNVTAGFPLLTPAIEAAFPGRVVRGADGQLLSIDRRPITFASQESQRIRYGLNVSGPIGKAGAEGGRGGPRAGGDGGGLPMRGMMGGRGGQGRWNLSVYHKVQLQDRVTVAANGPVLDLLGGDALSGGGQPRHAIELEGGVFHKGTGLRLNGTWTAPTRLEATGAPGSSDLRFGSVFNLDMRLFVDLGQKKAFTDVSPFFKGARLALTVDNLFDSRQRVTDASGAVPVSYQADFLDPRGRVIGIDFRKMF